MKLEIRNRFRRRANLGDITSREWHRLKHLIGSLTTPGRYNITLFVNFRNDNTLTSKLLRSIQPCYPFWLRAKWLSLRWGGAVPDPWREARTTAW